MRSPGTLDFEFVVPNPKQNGASSIGRSSWYPFYAGYCPVFVRELLRNVVTSKTPLIMDPWNGAGTTTQVASDLGFNAVGFDINPVMVTVARARTLLPTARTVLRSHVDFVTRRVRSYRSRKCRSGDPLSAWLDEEAASGVRRIERAIRERFSDEEFENRGNATVPVGSEAAFCYTALFGTLRGLLGSLRTSNPTWIKRPAVGRRPTFSRNELFNAFEHRSIQMLTAMGSEQAPRRRWPAKARARIETASSDRIPLKDGFVDAVIASPPYCTRIDYAVTTSVELAVLGYDSDAELRELRDLMIGTSTIRRRPPEPRRGWGRTCLKLIDAIGHHKSKASKSYYLKTFMQYFDDLHRSLGEISRCLRDSGPCVLVVQDSYYKEIHTDLPRIVLEMSRDVGLSFRARRDFPVTRSMVGVNRAAGRYRDNKCITESVLWFTATHRKEK